MKLIAKTVLLAACLLLVNCGDAPAEQMLQLSGNTMGTTYTLSVVSESTVSADAISSLLESIENSMSTYRDDSELMQLNRAELNTWLEVSPALFEVISLSQEISQLSDGAFDISVGPLVNLWGFGPPIPANDLLPEAAEIDTLLPNIGYQHIRLDPQQQAVMKTRDVALDLSAVAKGYAVDRIADLLETAGIDNYLVEIGGELRTGGLNLEGNPWRIAIENPESELSARQVQRIIAVGDAAIASSGDYRNFFTLNGERYSHTIDPRTGWPVSHDLVSVTVITENAARADALATAFSVMGENAAMLLAEENMIAAYFLRDSGGQLLESYSPAFSEFLVAEDNPSQ
ncbi:MAG: hypothetical protein CMP91_04460 [Gammaproteobacteria bacterium]|nr:hypothetical protein [Gammaproteobacteria bacterium]|tara:strand:+ start:369993 stop:371024 length:1032 start_codon:yes stop_codon:yes gene_type:complete